MGVTRDFEHLLEQLQLPDLSESALYELSDLYGPDLAHLAKAWLSLPDERRQSIVSRLVEIAEADFETDFSEVFKICLQDTDPQVRTTAIEGLWEVEDIVLIRPLVRLLSDDESCLVREAAAISLSRFALMAELGRLQSRQIDLVWTALWRTIHTSQEDLDVRRRAIESLAYFGRSEVEQVIEWAYQDRDERMRVSAVFAMGRSTNEMWADKVLLELERGEAEMRYEATRASGELRILEAVPTLSRLVADPDLEVRLAAIWALGQIGGAEATRVLEICCQMGNEALQDAAEEALSELKFMQGTLDFPFYDVDGDDDESDQMLSDDKDEID